MLHSRSVAGARVICVAVIGTQFGEQAFSNDHSIVPIA
jgi:hypothetical protein